MPTTTLDWINVAALLGSPILAGATALGIYWLGRRDAELTHFRQQRRYILTQLSVELAANDRIISQSLATIPPVLETIPRDADPNEAVITEDVFLAPLFTASFEGLVVNDLTHHVRSETIERLYDYYATAARANWLIGRVQGFKYRGPILREIEETLRSLRDPKRAVRLGLKDLVPVREAFHADAKPSA